MKKAGNYRNNRTLTDVTEVSLGVIGIISLIAMIIDIILFCIVSHVLDSPDLLLERAPLLNLIILRLDEAALAVILQIQIILQRLISCIGGYFFISTENG